jgi:hypothetical protein
MGRAAAFQMTDLELMQSIKVQWGLQIADSASAVPDLPQAFLAALVANESGGDAYAKRFEKNVLAALWEVLLGRKEAYGSIPRTHLVNYIAGVAAIPVNVPASLPADAFQCLDALATSWSLTQIMGWHALEPGFPYTLANLQDPASNLDVAVHMLAGFAATFHLSLANDAEALFRCWNTGHPTGQPFDPHYVPNGLTRMAICTSL